MASHLTHKEREIVAQMHHDRRKQCEIADSGIRWTEPRNLRFDEIDFRINGGKRPGIGSYHPKKVNVAMCNCGLQTLKNTTSPDMVKALTTIDGGEEVEPPGK